MDENKGKLQEVNFDLGTDGVVVVKYNYDNGNVNMKTFPLKTIKVKEDYNKALRLLLGDITLKIYNSFKK